jgi:hypothetical protein
MKTHILKQISFSLLFILLKVDSFSQNCQNNVIDNPNFELAVQRSGYSNEVVPTQGWSSLIPQSNSVWNAVEYRKPNTALQPNWVPQPASGNYLAMWISNHEQNQITFREGAINKLISPILQNSGQYSLSFDYCCLNTCSNDGGSIGELMPEIGIYVVHNPNSLSYVPFQTSHLPSNLNLLPNGNIALLAKVKLDKKCGNELLISNRPINEKGTKYSFETAFDANILNNSITHILITHSDEVILDASSYIGLDNFCLTKLSATDPCLELAKENKRLREELEKCCVRKPKPGIFKPKKNKP